MDEIFMNFNCIFVDLNTITFLQASRNNIITFVSMKTLATEKYKELGEECISIKGNNNWSINLKKSSDLYSFFSKTLNAEIKTIESLTNKESEEAINKLFSEILNNKIIFKNKRDLKIIGDWIETSKDGQIKKGLNPVLTFFAKVLWIPDYDWSNSFATQLNYQNISYI